MADNVARIIAAASAAGTACNLAVAYAKYRRERPRVLLHVVPKWVWLPHGTVTDDGETSFGDFRHQPKAWSVKSYETPYVELTIRNHGQSKVRVTSVTAELLSVERSLRYPRGRVGGGYVRDLEPLDPEKTKKAGDPVETPFEIEQFSGVFWETGVPAVLDGQPDALTARLRVAVTLSGGTRVHSRWMKPPLPSKSPPVDPPHEQLSLDLS